MDSDQTHKITPKRLEALADGVFTVAMTLLVLELAVPVIAQDSEIDILPRILAMWPKFVSYVLSFMVLGIYWIIHHKIFDLIKEYTSSLAWLNILFLMMVALIPFSTSLLGEYFLNTTTTFIYGIQLLLMFILGYSLYSYATSNKNILHTEVDQKDIRSVKVMGYVYFLVLIVAIILSLIHPLTSIIIYSLIVVVFILFTALNKDEYVISLKSLKK